jgi:copper chaperone CopZ
MNPTRIMLPIQGFGCLGGGALLVERALAHVPGVLRVYVNPATEMAYVQYDADRCAAEELRAAISRAGFDTGVATAP